jgi:hypothetical protein
MHNEVAGVEKKALYYDGRIRPQRNIGFDKVAVENIPRLPALSFVLNAKIGDIERRWLARIDPR